MGSLASAYHAMNREQLAHVLRAAAQIADDPDILVIGSQAILGTYSEEDLPSEATISVEVDIAFRDDPTDSKADRIDGAIGEGSTFHQTFAFYAQGVSVTTAVLPAGWEDRVVNYERPDADPSRARCIEAHDLVVSKLVAGREKDIDFATALIAGGLVDSDMLIERAQNLPVPGAVRKRVHASITRCARRAKNLQ
jgi:hypothetical protein